MFQPLVVAKPIPECLNQVGDGSVRRAVTGCIMIELVTKQDLRMAFDTLTLRLTVRLGMIVAAGVSVLLTEMGILALFLKLH
jgi:DNA-binding transcriptional regulator YdaS (Cro superfamily)